MSMIPNLQLSIKGLLNACVVFLLLLSAVHASEDSLSSVTIPRFNESITIDGYLTEPVWKDAAIIKDFYTYRPVDGQPATEQTAVLLGYDESSLYVAFICFDPFQT